MFFRRRSVSQQNVATNRLFGGRAELPPASVIGRNTRFRGEVRGGGTLVIRGQVEGSLRVQDRVMVEPGSSLRADVVVPEMVLAGIAEGEIRVLEILSVRSSGTLQGDVESGRILVEEGAVVRGTVRRLTGGRESPPDQSTP